VRDGRAYVTEIIKSADYPTTGAFDRTFNGGFSDAFVSRPAHGGTPAGGGGGRVAAHQHAPWWNAEPRLTQEEEQEDS
jgi:hypothetical protein